MVHLARLAGLDDQPGLRAVAGADQVVMHGGGGEQAWDRGVDGVHAAVGKDDDRVPVLDRLARILAKFVERGFQARLPGGGDKEHRDGDRLDVGEVQFPKLGEVVVAEDRLLELHQPRMRRRLLQQVPLAAEIGDQRRHQRLEVGVERRIGHLREELLEVVIEQLWPIAQAGERRVGAHRADRLGAVDGHRRHQDAQILDRVPERMLPHEQRIVIRRRHVLWSRQAVEVDEVVVEPLPPWALVDQVVLDLLVVDDPPLLLVDEEDLARLQPPFAGDVFRIDREHADFAGHDDQVVLGDVITGGSQAVAVEHRADDRAVGERDRGRPVPRLHQAGVVLVERLEVLVHQRVRLPCLGDHHQHRVRAANGH